MLKEWTGDSGGGTDNLYRNTARALCYLLQNVPEMFATWAPQAMHEIVGQLVTLCRRLVTEPEALMLAVRALCALMAVYVQAPLSQ